MIVPTKKSKSADALPTIDLANLGGGEVAYIRHLNAGEAKRLFPAIKGLPKNMTLFALHAADGTPLCVADSQEAALAHAMEGELSVTSVH